MDLYLQRTAMLYRLDLGKYIDSRPLTEYLVASLQDNRSA